MKGCCSWSYVALLPLYFSAVATISWEPNAKHTHDPNLCPLAAKGVETTDGRVTGHYAPGSDHVLEFLGIPYAEPPVGTLRFAPPQRICQRAAYNASNFSPICPQTASKPPSYPYETSQFSRIIAAFGVAGLNRTQSEDCLTLNLWTKAGEAGKPILVFFYGGRWSIGGTDSPFYNGEKLAAAQDVVVVTVNFRINIFGFPGTPGGPKNLGLLDQRHAVEWIRENARSFGGDPRKIVIFGQSSGSVAVSYWSYAYVNDPIVSGFICESGNAFSFPTNNEALAEQHWYNASAILGCGSSGDVLSCMRNVSFADLEAASAKVKPPPTSDPARSQPAFQPTVDNVTVFKMEEYARRSDAGLYAKLPYMFGNNNNEAGYYKITSYAQGTVLPGAAWTNFNLEDFTCPNTFEAVNHARAGVPTWLYRYFGDWDNLRLYPTSGAYHGTDLEMVFGNSAQVSGLPESEPEMQTRQVMMKAWATFANDPANGLSKTLGWPKFQYNESTLIRLAYNNSPVPSFARPSVYASTCPNLNLSYYTIR